MQIHVFQCSKLIALCVDYIQNIYLAGCIIRSVVDIKVFGDDFNRFPERELLEIIVHSVDGIAYADDRERRKAYREKLQDEKEKIKSIYFFPRIMEKVG